ncbi:MAG: DUF2141 domain-containing protein [Pseudomonadota bacterium]
MRAISHLAGGIVVTVAFLLLGGFLASTAPAYSVAATTTLGPVDGTSPAVDRTPGTGLTVNLVGIQGNTGQLIVLVFEDRLAYEAYDDNQAVGIDVAPVGKASSQPVVFPALNDGPYAVAVFHDENGDFEFNMRGPEPLEGYGASGATTWYDVPTFEQAAIDGGSVNVQLFYPQ